MTNDPILTCKLYAETLKGLYFEVKIFESRKAMLAALKQCGDTDLRRVYAATHGYKPHGKEIGTIFFYKGQHGPRTTIHEITHAALWYCEAKNIDPVRDEERFCDIVGDMYGQMYRELLVNDFFEDKDE